MIFVTVGTHEQPFDRLLIQVDKLKRDQVITEPVIMQTGFSTYEPQYCTWKRFFPYQDMVDKMSEAHIVLSHGGPSSFIIPIQMKKIPVVVPRQKRFGEHVNDHQVRFCEAVFRQSGNIIVINDINDLKKCIIDYDSIVKTISSNSESHNLVFNQEFEQIVNNLFDINDN